MLSNRTDEGVLLTEGLIENTILNFSSRVSDMVKNILGKLNDPFIVQILEKLGLDIVLTQLKKLFGTISKDPFKAILVGVSVTAILAVIIKYALPDRMTEALESFLKSIKGLFVSAIDLFQHFPFWNTIKGSVKGISKQLNAIDAIGILAQPKKIISNIIKFIKMVLAKPVQIIKEINSNLSVKEKYYVYTKGIKISALTALMLNKLDSLSKTTILK